MESHSFVMSQFLRRLYPQLTSWENLLLAWRNERRAVEPLEQADSELKALRKNLLICYKMGVLSAGQFQHVTRLVAEVGALLGAWLKDEKKPPAPRRS